MGHLHLSSPLEKTNSTCYSLFVQEYSINPGGGVSAVKWSSMLEHETSERLILCGFSSWIYPHSIHFRATPHSFCVNGVTEKTLIPHISRIFSKYCCRTQAFCAGKPPIPHTVSIILMFTPVSHQVFQNWAHFVSTQFHTIFQFSTPHSAPNSLRACYSTFWASRPPLVLLITWYGWLVVL